MITDMKLYQSIWQLADQHSKILLYLKDGDAIKAIAQHVGAESFKIQIDDLAFDTDYASNGDMVYFDFDDILGYELR